MQERWCQDTKKSIYGLHEKNDAYKVGRVGVDVSLVKINGWINK